MKPRLSILLALATLLLGLLGQFSAAEDKPPGFEWENPGSMNTSFGYNQNDHHWVDARELVFRLVDIVSKGGNYLLNVGPTSEGLIPQPSIDRLMEVGAWMETNGEAIYGTSPWKVYGEGPRFVKAAPAPAKSAGASFDIRFTAKGNSLYAICLAWPEQHVVVRALGHKGSAYKTIVAARMLGSQQAITWHQTDDGLVLSVPREKPWRYAFVYRIDFQKH
jgi:alpha-L-fucosidase